MKVNLNQTHIFLSGEIVLFLFYKKMEIEQNKIIESHWKNRKKNKFIKSKFDVLILASIIEKEGKKVKS